MNQNCSNANDVGSFCDAAQGIEQESFAQPLSLLSLIHGKSCEEHNTDRMIAQALGNPLRTFVLVDRSGSEGVIANRAIAIKGNVRLGGIRLLARPCKLPQPFVEGAVGAVEATQ